MAIGIEISARTQYVLMGVQMISMFVFATWALIKAYTAHPSVTSPATPVHSHAHVHLTWFGWHQLSWTQITQGIVLAIFLYWGWDTATSVNEESKNSHVLPGVSAVLSTILLVFTYVFVTVACQAYCGSRFLAINWSDVFTPLARAVGGPSTAGQILFRFVMIAVFTSGAASALTTLLPLTRSTLSMASHKAFPKIFGRVHPKYMTPFWGTVIMTVISIVWYAGMTAISPNILGDAIGALGLMVCFVYGFTGLRLGHLLPQGALQERQELPLHRSRRPFVGGIMMMVVLYYAGKTYWAPSYSYTWPDTGIKIFGAHIGVTFVLGIGVIALSFILMFITWPIYKRFYARKPETWPGEGQPIPYSDETVV